MGATASSSTAPSKFGQNLGFAAQFFTYLVEDLLLSCDMQLTVALIIKGSGKDLSSFSLFRYLLSYSQSITSKLGRYVPNALFGEVSKIPAWNVIFSEPLKYCYIARLNGTEPNISGPKNSSSSTCTNSTKSAPGILFC